ncbi:hypothetical protein K439DRAFT_1612604 [Ramaria rubella]|nr:hypothetical protein K439DRAFT_1612604 [Ramaria rubella]
MSHLRDDDLRASNPSLEFQPFVFRALPIEIIRYIFEFAATPRRTALALCLLSKQINNWITPILYHTVVFDELTTVIYNSFYSGSNQTRPTARHIRRLYLASVPHRVLLKDCHGLVDLKLHCYTSPASYHPPPIATITHVTLASYDLNSFMHYPFLRSVTHIHLAKGFLSSPTSSNRPHTFTPTYLPNLTHLVYNIGHIIVPLNGLDAILRRFIHIISPDSWLRIVGIYIDPGEPELIASHIERVSRNLPNIIIKVSDKFYPGDWRTDSIWHRVKREFALA